MGHGIQSKRKSIEELLTIIEKRLAAAEEYVACNVNVEGATWLHFDDWQGKSGHPSWMKNFMIPSTKRVRARKEKALDRIETKIRSKNLTKRRRGV